MTNPFQMYPWKSEKGMLWWFIGKKKMQGFNPEIAVREPTHIVP